MSPKIDHNASCCRQKQGQSELGDDKDCSSASDSQRDHSCSSQARMRRNFNEHKATTSKDLEYSIRELRSQGQTSSPRILWDYCDFSSLGSIAPRFRAGFMIHGLPTTLISLNFSTIDHANVRLPLFYWKSEMMMRYRMSHSHSFPCCLRGFVQRSLSR